MIVNDEMREAFQRDGFVLVPDVLSQEEVDAVKGRYEALFRGDFETEVYPDEWHWRKGLSLPDVTREICNGWKSDLTIRKAALSCKIESLSKGLMAWPSVRLAQDSVLWKPPGAKGVAWHTDGRYISDNFVPKDDNSVTVWCSLDHACEQTGVVRYARGSHKWRHSGVGGSSSSGFHDAEGGANRMERAAQAAGIDPRGVEVVSLKVAAGDAVVHHQNTWHGSGPNLSTDIHRRALAVHVLRGDVRFIEHPSYIYGRYKLADTDALREEFFPFLGGSAGA